MMGSVNPLSDTSGEVGTLGISHIMKPTPQNDSSAVSAMNQPTDPKVFRFLDLPPEIRNKIYGNLLIYHEPVVLNTIYMPNNRELERVVYSTRLGLAPQICRASKAVACECFAVLYGENTFHFTSDNRIPSLFCVGIDMYLHYFKIVVMDTFMSSFKAKLQNTSLSRKSTYLPGARLLIESKDWVAHDPFIDYLENVKKLRLNLPPGLDNLTERNRDSLLEIKRDVPKHATVEFHGATSHIVSQIMTAWPSYVPKSIEPEPPMRDLQPFNPLKWYNEQVKKQNRGKSRFPSPPSMPTFPTTQVTVLKRQPLDRCFSEEPRAFKKQKRDEEIPLHGSSSLASSAEKIKEDGLKINTEVQLVAAEEKSLASKEKNITEEKLTLEKKKLALGKDELSLEKKRLALDKEELTLENKKLALEMERLALEKRKLTMKG